MLFRATEVEGAYIVELERRADERGSFSRVYCGTEFAKAGIRFDVAQANLSRNTQCHTLRGMHGNVHPNAEAKLVQCVRGRIFDVAVDIRPNSSTFGKCAWIELSGDRDFLFYIPPGCAHGFLTLEPNSDILYYMGTPYAPGTELGVRWNDPAFAIPWPEAPQILSDRDASYPDWQRPAK